MKLLKNTEDYVRKVFAEKLDSRFTYHNLEHTLGVVNASKIIAEKEGFDSDDMEILIVAAWFHDIGYIKSTIDHEEHSKTIATDFLKKENCTETFINQVKECIDATKIPQHPKNKISRVLSDADAYHLSQDSFIEASLMLRKERNTLNNTKISKSDFLKLSLEFIKAHQYHTEYGKKYLCNLKEQNQIKLESLIKEMEDNPDILDELKAKNGKKDKTDKPKSLYSSKGAESMFRLTARNQINLSAIADNKANIMITINTLILSAVVTLLVRKITENPNLLIPTFILFSSCIISIIFAILATLPKISSGTFTKEDIHNRKVNLLFFGNFFKMNLEEYDWAVREMIKEDDYLYGNMIKDQYYLGLVLARKYRMIRICYMIFMFGFTMSIMAFAITFIYYPS